MSAPAGGAGVVGVASVDGPPPPGAEPPDASVLSSPEPEVTANAMPPPPSRTITIAPTTHQRNLRFRTAEQ